MCSIKHNRTHDDDVLFSSASCLSLKVRFARRWSLWSGRPVEKNQGCSAKMCCTRRVLLRRHRTGGVSLLFHLNQDVASAAMFSGLATLVLHSRLHQRKADLDKGLEISASSTAIVPVNHPKSSQEPQPRTYYVSLPIKTRRAKFPRTLSIYDCDFGEKEGLIARGSLP